MARLSEKFERLARGEGRRAHTVFAREEDAFLHVPVEEITPDPHQPRQNLGDLEGLKELIRKHGILQPLVVSPNGLVGYRLIAGERRYRAARDLGLETVPALVRTIEEHLRLEVQLVENLLRKDLDPLEEARSYRRLMDEYSLTQEAVGQRIGKSVASINEILRLLDLSPTIQDEFRTSETDAKNVSKRVSKSVLLEIAKQPTEEEQEKLWEEARQGNLTVKKARTAKIGAISRSTVPPVVALNPLANLEAESYSIATPDALVTVTFDSGKATSEAVRAALRYALETLNTS